MPEEVLYAIKEIQGTPEELATIRDYVESGADKDAPLGKDRCLIFLVPPPPIFSVKDSKIKWRILRIFMT
jgi:hypothetical protein